IVLGVASVGVLVEAFVPRAQRYAVQVALSAAGCAAAVAAAGLLAGRNEVTAAGAISIDGMTLFLQGVLGLLGLLSVLLLGERAGATGGALVAQAALVAGSPPDRRQATVPTMQTEAFPLALFALGGMMLFPASNNLLLMFVALEVLSLPL